VVLIDAIYVKIRDGQVANRPVYVALGINCQGERDVLGLWAGTGGEGAKAWMATLAELRNRGVEDVCIVACDGLKGLPDAIAEIWLQATVQLCVVHLARASLRYASKKYWSQISKDLREIYTAPSEAAAITRFAEFEEAWGQQYPAIIRLWRSAWEQFTPFPGVPARGQKGDLYDQRDRVAERPVPAGHPAQRPFPERAGRAEGALPGHPDPAEKPG
jgi:putative transposase